MKETGILFKPDMIRAILNTKLATWPPEPIDPDKAFKGMTRRIIKPQPNIGLERGCGDAYWYDTDFECAFHTGKNIKCPYGQPGDFLWVKEAINYEHKFPCATQEPNRSVMKPVYKQDKQPHIAKMIKWRSPLFMPKAAARIWLQITDIKPERLQDISQTYALWEGVEFLKCLKNNSIPIFKNYSSSEFLNYKLTARASFQTLINAINGPETWDKNPWVWSISFKVLSVTGRPSQKQVEHAQRSP